MRASRRRQAPSPMSWWDTPGDARWSRCCRVGYFDDGGPSNQIFLPVLTSPLPTVSSFQILGCLTHKGRRARRCEPEAANGPEARIEAIERNGYAVVPVHFGKYFRCFRHPIKETPRRRPRAIRRRGVRHQRRYITQIADQAAENAE